MTEKQYYKYMAGKDYVNDLFPIFQFFEPYTSCFSDLKVEGLSDIQQEIINKELKMLISKVGKKLTKNKFKIIQSFTKSLQTNLRGFLNLDADQGTDGIQLKWKKVIFSYINFSRLVMDYEKIQHFVNNPKEKRMILCVGMINIEKDDINVNEEISMIQELSLNNKYYLVLPIIGCSFDVFKTLTKKHDFHWIHFSGHGSEKKLEFADEAVGYKAFQNHIIKTEKRYELLYLSCCHTYEFVKRISTSLAKYYICYEGELAASESVEKSELFYNAVFLGSSVEKAWNIVEVCSELYGYHLIISDE